MAKQRCSSCKKGIKRHYFINHAGKFCPSCYKLIYPKDYAKRVKNGEDEAL